MTTDERTATERKAENIRRAAPLILALVEEHERRQAEQKAEAS